MKDAGRHRRPNPQGGQPGRHAGARGLAVAGGRDGGGGLDRRVQRAEAARRVLGQRDGADRAVGTETHPVEAAIARAEPHTGRRLRDATLDRHRGGGLKRQQIDEVDPRHRVAVVRSREREHWIAIADRGGNSAVRASRQGQAHPVLTNRHWPHPRDLGERIPRMVEGDVEQGGGVQDRLAPDPVVADRRVVGREMTRGRLGGVDLERPMWLAGERLVGQVEQPDRIAEPRSPALRPSVTAGEIGHGERIPVGVALATLGDLRQRRAGLLQGPDGHGGADRVVRPAQGQRAGQIGERHRPPGQPVGEIPGTVRQQRGGFRRQQQRHRTVGIDRRRRGRPLGQDRVGVGASEAEGADTGAADMTGPARPRRGPLRHRQGLAGQIDAGIERRESGERRQRLGLEGGDHLGEADDPRRLGAVTERRLGRAESDRRQRGIATGEGTGQPGDLHRVAKRRAGAVRLDQVDGIGVQPGAVQRAPDDRRLGHAVRGGDAVAAAVLVGGGRQHDGVDPVTVGPRPLQRLEHGGDDRLADHDAVSPRVEGGAASVGREHAGAAHQRQSLGIEEQADAADQRHLAVAARQPLDGEVESDQRGRAGGIDRQRRAAEIQVIGDPRGEQRRQVAGHAPGIAGAAIGRDEPLVARRRGADIHPDPGAGDAIRRIAGVLQRQMGPFQEQPLLRVHGAGLAWRQAEQGGVEPLDPLQEPAQRRFVRPRQQRADQTAAVRRQRADEGPPLGQRPLERRQRRRRTERAGQADHRHRIAGRGRRAGHRRIRSRNRRDQRSHVARQGARARMGERGLDPEIEPVGLVDRLDHAHRQERPEAEIGETARRFLAVDPLTQDAADHLVDAELLDIGAGGAIGRRRSRRAV